MSQLLASGMARLVVDGLDPQYWKGQVKQLDAALLKITVLMLPPGSCDIRGGRCLLAFVLQQL